MLSSHAGYWKYDKSEILQLKFEFCSAHRRVATCKQGKPGLTSFSKTLALFFIQFLSFRKMGVQDRQNGPSGLPENIGWLRAWLKSVGRRENLENYETYLALAEREAFYPQRRTRGRGALRKNSPCNSLIRKVNNRAPLLLF